MIISEEVARVTISVRVRVILVEVRAGTREALLGNRGVGFRTSPPQVLQL